MTTSTEPTHQTTLAELATTRAGASRVFHRHGLDFCCGGRVPLADACAKKGIDPDALLAELRREEEGAAPRERWDAAPLEALVEHVIGHFHEGQRAEVPRLLAMARKVESVHADKASCPKGLADHLARMQEELGQHMQKEEQVLFPMILSGRGRMAQMPVQCMEQEHRDHAANLVTLRSLAHDFDPPAEACNTWRALYLGLDEFEQALMEHVHLENNVLFPRALAS